MPRDVFQFWPIAICTKHAFFKFVWHIATGNKSFEYSITVQGMMPCDAIMNVARDAQ